MNVSIVVIKERLVLGKNLVSKGSFWNVIVIIASIMKD
jgi:hypothetical protein